MTNTNLTTLSEARATCERLYLEIFTHDPDSPERGLATSRYLKANARRAELKAEARDA